MDRLLSRVCLELWKKSGVQQAAGASAPCCPHGGGIVPLWSLSCIYCAHSLFEFAVSKVTSYGCLILSR